MLIDAFFISCNRGENKSDVMADYVKAELQEPPSQKNGDKDKQQIPFGNLKTVTADSAVNPISTMPGSNPDCDSKIIKTASIKVEIKDF